MATSGHSPVLELPGLVDVSPLGHGGFADVYLGRQVHLERWVAAKVFRVTLDDPEAADRFRAECRTLGLLDQYPHVLTVHDAGVLPDGRPYLVSERCDGSLSDLVAVRGRLPVERAVEIGLPVARAVLFAHRHGVLHGDVTPRNVLLRASGAPVLADFGMAVLQENRGAPAAGYTATHAAPETVLHGTVDEAVDVFGLGSTLWTALAGAAPFPSHPAGDSVRLARIEAGPPPPPGGGSPLTAVLIRMLAPDPARRPGMDEVVSALGGTGSAPPARPAAPETEYSVPPTARPFPARSANPCRPASPGAVPRPSPGPRPPAARPRPPLSGPAGPPPVPVGAPSGSRARSVVPWLVVGAAAVVGACLGAWWYAADTAPPGSATPSTSASSTVPAVAGD